MSGRKLGRNGSHRRDLYRNLVTSFLRHERIETTEAKGKEIRAIADRMISLGKKGDLHSRRMASAYIMSRGVVSSLFSDIAPRFSGRNGGYTRLIKTRFRYGDAAPMVILELTETESALPLPSEKDDKPKKEVKDNKEKSTELKKAKTTTPKSSKKKESSSSQEKK
jgi:large subunit ribosomal protein L17